MRRLRLTTALQEEGGREPDLSPLIAEDPAQAQAAALQAVQGEDLPHQGLRQGEGHSKNCLKEKITICDPNKEKDRKGQVRVQVPQHQEVHFPPRQPRKHSLSSSSKQKKKESKKKLPLIPGLHRSPGTCSTRLHPQYREEDPCHHAKRLLHPQQEAAQAGQPA